MPDSTEIFNLEAALEPHAAELAEYADQAQQTEEARKAIGDLFKLPDKDEGATPENPLEFPAWIMSGAAGAFAEAYSEYLEAPASFLYMSFLTILGNIVSESITLQSELKPQPRLFTVILGQSADERKSTAITKALDFFRSTMDQGSVNTCYGVGSAEGLAKALDEAPKLILAIDELKTFVQKAKIEGSVLLPCVNTLFELNRFHSVTKKHAITLEHAHLSLLAASTLETYQTMFNSAFMDIGFINRLFTVLDKGKKRFALPRMIPRDVKDELGKHLQSVLVIAEYLSEREKPHPMPLHPAALRAFEEWYFETPRSVFAKRLDTYGHRLMPLLAINDQKKDIDLETVQKVIALLNYQLAVRREADPVDADTKIAVLEERIRRTLSNGPLFKRDLERKLNKARCGNWAWNNAIRNLTKDGEIRFDRKRNVYEPC
jgi:hypothetical protein